MSASSTKSSTSTTTASAPGQRSVAQLPPTPALAHVLHTTRAHVATGTPQSTAPSQSTDTINRRCYASDMDTPFTLRLSVEQKNKPPDLAEVSEMSVRTTLRHTPMHLTHLIWLFSANNELMPIFLKLCKDGTSLLSSTPLLQVLNTEEPSEGLELALVIDYTLFNSPYIPKRPPHKDQFRLETTLTRQSAPEITASCDATLCDTILSVKGQISRTLGVPEDDLELLDPATLQALSDEATLRDVLGLDVPPLNPVLLLAKKRVPRFKLRLFSLENPDAAVVLTVFSSTTVCELRDAAAEVLDKDARFFDLFFRTHCFSKSTSRPSQALLLELFNFADYSAESPFSIGYRYVEGAESFEENTEDDEEEGVADSEEMVFELEVNGDKVLLSLAECRISEGILHLSPDAVSKVNAQWGMNMQNPSIRPTPTEPDRNQEEREEADRETNEGTEDVNTTEERAERSERETETAVPEANVTGVQTESSDAVFEVPQSANPESQVEFETQEQVQIQNTVELDQNQADQNGAETQNQVDAEQGNANVGAFRIIVNNLYNNQVLIVQLLMQVCLAAFLMVGDSIIAHLKPYVIIPLSIMVISIAYFSFGGEISRWLDENILAHSAPDTFDYHVVHFISQGFRTAHSANAAVTGLVNGWYLQMLRFLHTKKYLALEQRVFDLGPPVAAKRLVAQGALFLLMAAATLFPTLEHLTNEFVVQLAQQEEDEIDVLIREYVKKLQEKEHGDVIFRVMKERLPLLMDDFRCEACDYNERIRLYLMLAWAVKRGRELEEMPTLAPLT